MKILAESSLYEYRTHINNAHRANNYLASVSVVLCQAERKSLIRYDKCFTRVVSSAEFAQSNSIAINELKSLSSYEAGRRY